mgnify:CR=1 FL=1
MDSPKAAKGNNEDNAFSPDINDQKQLKMSGYLQKKSTAGEWQKRYFETNGTYLTYYKSHKMNKLLAALSLPQVGKIAMLDKTSSDASGGWEGATFQLDLKDRQYILKTTKNDPEEAKQWVDTLLFLRDGGENSNSNSPKNMKNLDGEETASNSTTTSTDMSPISASEEGFVKPKQLEGCGCIMS